METLESFSQIMPDAKKQSSKLISRYIEEKIIKKNESAGAEDEREIEEYYKSIDARERAEALYEKILAYRIDKQAEAARKQETEEKGGTFDPIQTDPWLVSEIKVLSADPEVRKIIPETYGQARADKKLFRLSELSKLWKSIEDEIKRKEETYRELARDLHLNKISGRGKISAARSRMERIAQNLTALERRKNDIETLQGMPKIAENTDITANLMYEKLKEYKRQIEGPGKFVWLPSRKKIHQETVSAILNHRWPELVGEAGTGKSQQANAAAIELTGHLPTKVQCESSIGEKQLIEDIAIDPETGGSYKEYGPLMQAYTGYEDSRQAEPKYKTGRIARFDESGRLGQKAYSIIKEVRQLSPGEELNGRPVLPGAGAIWTTNPVGPRYPDRHMPDPAMRRELAEILVDYPEMSAENPELYEFALTALLDENDRIRAAKEELSPAYDKKDIPEDQREILEDGSIVVAREEILENMADGRHGALWRFCGAIKALQDSFVFSNAETEKYPETLLRYKEDADGNIEITADGSGEVLTLSSSTVTLGELASWMSGFNERRQKRDEDFRTNTLSEWLDFKIRTYLKQADKADKDKIEAIFRHFHFLSGEKINLSSATPLTPKEIGYLSPRAPRPVYIEKPLPENLPLAEEETLARPMETYVFNQVLLENGERIEIAVKNFDFKISDVMASIDPGGEFKIGGEDFSFAGIVQSADSEHQEKPVGKLAGEDLYKIFSPEELVFGSSDKLREIAGETGIDDFQEDFLETWKDEGCEGKYGSLF